MSADGIQHGIEVTKRGARIDHRAKFSGLCAHTVWEKDVDGSECLVDAPPHYTVGGFEALDVIKAKLTPEEYRGYCKGNILKYLMRANYKGTHDTDCGKAEYYSKELMETINGKEES